MDTIPEKAKNVTETKIGKSCLLLLFVIARQFTHKMFLSFLTIFFRVEAKQCPAIVVADIDTRVFHDKQTVKVQRVSYIFY